MVDKRTEQKRQDRLRRTRRRPTQPVQEQQYGATESLFFVVLRSVDQTNGTMKCQRIRFSDSPPVIGNLEAFGPLLDCYPMPTETVEPYALLEYPDIVQGDEQTPQAITNAMVPCIAIRDTRGFLMVMIAPKFEASLLPDGEAPNECSS